MEKIGRLIYSIDEQIPRTIIYTHKKVFQKKSSESYLCSTRRVNGGRT